MSAAEIKTELYQLIDAINDSKTLKAIHTLLTSGKKQKTDWWDSISVDEKKAIEIGLKQLKDGKGIPHHEVRKKVDALLSRKS